MSEKTCALIILNYNDAPTTKSLVNLVKDYESLNRLVVVDNASGDGSYYELQKLESEKVHVIRAKENGGYAKGNNVGLRYAIANFSPDILFVANPDVEFTEETVAHMKTALSENGNVGVVAPIVNQGTNVWSLPGYLGILEELFLVWFNLDKKAQKKKLLASAGLCPVGVVEGSFYAMKTADYMRIGGLDEKTFLYCEENILARRLKNIGKDVCVLADDRYDHFHGRSIKKHYRSKAKAFHNFHDSFAYYCREYLHTGFLRNALFEFCYFLAWLERVAYDLVNRLKAGKKA